MNLEEKNNHPKNEVPWNMLVIDDDTLFCDVISSAGMGENVTVHTANTAIRGLELCSQYKMDVVLLDQQLPDKNGSEICHAILSENEQTKIIIATAYPDFGNAVEAIKLGAYNYLAKPFDIDELSLIIKRACEATELEQVTAINSWKNKKEADKSHFIGTSLAAQDVRNTALLAAGSKASTLLTGSTGTGKTLLARYIHAHSILRDKVFLSINCATLPENLIEAELFGVEKGAFTDAHKTRRGIFEIATGGTLFLDEISTLPHHLQAKLLGVLDDGRIRRLGSESDQKVDVRIIAATNSNLVQKIEEGSFREDLFYRLSVLSIELPTLSQRKGDIRELCHHFLTESQAKTISEDEYSSMAAYHWPGNIRELKNILERALLLATGKTLTPSTFLAPIPASPATAYTPSSPLESYPGDYTLKNIEKKHIEQTLTALKQNRSKTARSLDISRSTLIRKLKQYDLDQGLSLCD